MATERYVVSFGRAPAIYELRDGELFRERDFVNVHEWRDAVWPVLMRRTNSLLFEARHKDDRGTWIYQVPFAAGAADDVLPRKFIQGRSPSLSPDEKFLAYIAGKEALTVIDVGTREVVRVVNEVSADVPAVWIDGRILLYVTTGQKVIAYDVEEGRGEDIGFDGLVPQMKIPGRDEVLCGYNGGKSVAVLDVKRRETRKLMASKFLKLGRRFVLRPDGKGFFYERQVWGNALLLSEAYSIFSYGWDGQEVKIVDKGVLVGGFPLEGD